MSKQIDKAFWDKFDNEQYQKIVDDREEEDVLQIRIPKNKKVEFKDNCKNKGGMGNVLRQFIDELNRREKSKNK